jgi:isoleucyl-tRNA synthetase/broad specificity phosphatase PhoE
VITNEAIAVSDEEGTGIVHLTSSTGEDSNAAARAEGVDVLPHVAIDGSFIPAVTDFVGLNAKPEGKDPQSTDKIVIENLKRNGRAFSWFTITHSYPHCWRCDTPLLPYTTNSWFVAVEKIKSAMLKANAKTRWVPAHLRDGRFGKWIENARDWAISRNRYWGTPLPVWKCAATGEVEVIGSRDELMAKIPKRFTKVTVIRHAQSVGNTLPIYQSALPGTDLTEKGRAQAAAAAAFLKSRVASRESPVAKTIIYTSPLARAEQTAAVIADALTAKVITDERLREVSFGDYEGKKVDFSDLKFVRERRAHKIESGKVESVYHFPGMETWDSVQERIEAFLREALPNHRGEHVVLVTHADVVVNLKHFFTKEDPVKLSHQPYPGFAEPESYFWDHESGSALDLHKHVVDDLRWETTKSKVLPTTLTVVYHDDATNARKLVETLNASDHDAIVTLSSGEAKKAGDMLAASWKKDLHAMKASEGASGPAIREAIADMLRHFSGKRVLLLAPTSWTNFIHAFGHADAAWKPDDSTTAETYLLQPLFERVPEVLDCWFESGSMPYAQEHFPFNPNSQFPAPNSPRGFPADFIAEGIDQTRGWFYTLTVLSTALFKKPAFLNCIVNGTVLAEDGKKMSKRLKNYPEPLAVVEKHGADAVRFALMKSPAVRAEDMRFSEKLVEETVRSVLLPLWNTYSFLVTYANLANVEIQPTPTASKHPLDQWILAEMQDLVNRMSAQLDAYDLSKACAELEGTIDALTNWYVRLSRRRFAGKGEGGVNDQKAALETLHSVLLTLTQTLAPFCPFITEAIYLNLVPIEHGSIHFTDWPAVRKLKKAEQLLLSRTRLLRSIVSLGMKVRAEHTIKLRQPLKAAFVAIPAVLRDVVRLETDEEHLLREELNVKELTFVDDPSTLAEVFVQVDARKVGPRLGGKVQELIKAGKLGEFTENDDGTLTILGERLNADEAAIQYRGKEGRNIASSHGIVVALDATVSDELKQEGVARDLVRAIQKLRKDAGLKITDKIALEVNGADALMDLHGTVICAETNAVLKSAKGETHEIDLDGEKVTIRFAAL